jgi:hypothetical protein
MRPHRTVLMASSLCVALATLPVESALAHSILVSPLPIINDDGAKSGPCGCYFGAGPQSGEDPSPVQCPGTFPITELVAGSSLVVKWKETVNHNGNFRIAFTSKTPQEATRADLDAGVLVTVPDTNTVAGATLHHRVQLPDTPCDNCTLQLRQFMQGGGTTPYYYSCANVRLVAASTDGGTMTPDAVGGEVDAGAGADGGSIDAGSGDDLGMSPDDAAVAPPADDAVAGAADGGAPAADAGPGPAAVDAGQGPGNPDAGAGGDGRSGSSGTPAGPGSGGGGGAGARGGPSDGQGSPVAGGCQTVTAASAPVDVALLLALLLLARRLSRTRAIR